MSHAARSPLTVGIIQHQAADCPAHPDNRAQADVVVPALRQAAADGRVPASLVFATKSHKGAFVADGTTTEVEAAMPDLPLHEARFFDATGDEAVHEILHDPSGLQTDEAARHRFIDHVEHTYGEEFPDRHQGPVVPGAELADFIAAKHQ